MATNRRTLIAVPAAAASLLWPAVWNGYPIVFADTGTYLSQAIHRYAGWDRPIFYSLFVLPLHGTLTLWPIVVVQAVLTASVLWVVCRVLAPLLSAPAFIAGVAVLSACTWLPWIVSEVMPDLFTPLLILVIALLAWVPERLSWREQISFVALATFMIASQQSSVPLACILIAVLGSLRSCLTPKFRTLRTSYSGGSDLLAVAPQQLAAHGAAGSAGIQGLGPAGSAQIRPLAFPPGYKCSFPAKDLTAIGSDWKHPSPCRRWLLLLLPPLLAIAGLCTVNLAAHGRFAISPFGNIFLLARVIYDGPGMAALQRDCGAAQWRLCAFLGRFPATSDDFLWLPDSPLYRVGGPKIVSQEASAIIKTSVMAAPAAEAGAMLHNTLQQLVRFKSGDGLEPWPEKVSPWIDLDFPAAERAAYAAARQQTDRLRLPEGLDLLHRGISLLGVAGVVILLPVALLRRSASFGFLLAALLSLPISAAITGGLSAPHDRYQSRIMWLPPAVAAISLASLRRGSLIF